MELSSWRESMFHPTYGKYGPDDGIISAMFIQPKYAKMLATQALRSALGEGPAPDTKTSSPP